MPSTLEMFFEPLFPNYLLLNLMISNNKHILESGLLCSLMMLVLPVPLAEPVFAHDS